LNGKIVYGAIDELEEGDKSGLNEYFVVDGAPITKKYKEVGMLRDINGKLAFIAQDGNNKYFVVYDGVEGKKYDDIRFLEKLDGRPVYCAANMISEGEAELLIIVGDQPIKTYNIKSLFEVNNFEVIEGKIMYSIMTIDKDMKKKYIVAYGDEIYEGSDDVMISFYPIDDKVVKVMQPKKGKIQVSFGSFTSGVYDEPSEFGAAIINGRVAFVAKRNGKEFMVNIDGTEGKKYDFIRYLNNVNGSLVYIAKEVPADPRTELEKNNSSGKIFVPVDSLGADQFVVKDGIEGEKYEKIQTEYGIHGVEVINGRVAYVGIKKDGTPVLNVEGESPKEFPRHFISHVKEINKKLAYVLVGKTEDIGKAKVVYDGQEGKKYDDIEKIIDANGKLVYLAKDGEEMLVVYDGAEGKKYEDIDSFKFDVEAGKLFYVVRKKEDSSSDQQEFVVREE
jgi:hypothetical protein